LRERIEALKPVRRTLIEVIGILTVIVELASLLIPRLSEAIKDSRASNAAIDNARVNITVKSVNRAKVAMVEHFVKWGSLPVDDKFDLLLMRERLLKKPFSCEISTNSHVQAVRALASGDIVTATNAAYNWDGCLTNQANGTVVVEAVLLNVKAEDARNLSLRLDGSEFSSPLGKADLQGKVKFAAISRNGVGEVHIYFAYR
jgi:hypothetical protein